MAYFDPQSVSSIASVLDGLLADPERMAALASAGRRRARQFTWERSANATLAAYRRTLADAMPVSPPRSPN